MKILIQTKEERQDFNWCSAFDFA